MLVRQVNNILYYALGNTTVLWQSWRARRRQKKSTAEKIHNKCRPGSVFFYYDTRPGNKVWLILQMLAWSPILTSTTEVCRGSCNQSFICSMCRKEFRTNSASQCRLQLLARPITAVPRRSLCTSVRRLSKAASSIRYSASLGGSAMPAQHTRSTGLLCGRPVALELSTSQLERSGSWQGRLQTSAEDAFMYTVPKHLAY